MNIKPLADRVVVKPMEQEEKKQGGIIIPDTAKEKPQEGEIIAVGPGKVSESGEKIAMEVKKGDLAVFPKGLRCTWYIKEPMRKHFNLKGD